MNFDKTKEFGGTGAGLGAGLGGALGGVDGGVRSLAMADTMGRAGAPMGRGALAKWLLKNILVSGGAGAVGGGVGGGALGAQLGLIADAVRDE